LILQFFLNNLLVLVIGAIQIIFFKLISFRLPTNHQNFVDLCAITNISVFIIDEPLHGYYIHGKYLQKSEIPFTTLITQMYVNNNNDKRGLDNNDPNQIQTYEL